MMDNPFFVKEDDWIFKFANLLFLVIDKQRANPASFKSVAGRNLYFSSNTLSGFQIYDPLMPYFFKSIRYNPTNNLIVVRRYTGYLKNPVVVVPYFNGFFTKAIYDFFHLFIYNLF